MVHLFQSLVSGGLSNEFTRCQDQTLYGTMMDNMVLLSSSSKSLHVLIGILFTGLIRWKIVIHAFVDGYSRMVTGIQASNNNRAATVLQLFLAAIQEFRLPSRVRGDHGVENLQVAAYMETERGIERGSYIWGR